MNYSLPVLVYHKIEQRKELGITSLSPTRFERQIEFLKYEEYTDILQSSFFFTKHCCTTTIWTTAAGDLNDITPAVEQIQTKTQKNKFILITFDDGYEGIYTYAYPVLKKHSYSAIVFLTTGYIGKYNNWDKSPGPRFKHLDLRQIKEMAQNGILFGSHGVSHTFLTKQGDIEARYEIEASKKKLEDELGVPIRFFSYPYGNYNDRIMSYVQEAGYDAAFSLRPEMLKGVLPFDGKLKYMLPRIAIYLIDNMGAFKAKIGYSSNGSLPYIQKVKNSLINRCAYASMILK